MSIAGRILIMPKGDYDANSAYEKLDLVRHKGTSWIAKKDVTGIEPSAENSEYWQNMFDISIANNLTTEEEGYTLDARQGKVLNEKIDNQGIVLDEKIAEIKQTMSSAGTYPSGAKYGSFEEATLNEPSFSMSTFTVYIAPNATDLQAPVPTSTHPRWYNVLQLGRHDRTTQIAFSIYGERDKIYIRNKHDYTWYGWYSLTLS